MIYHVRAEIESAEKIEANFKVKAKDKAAAFDAVALGLLRHLPFDWTVLEVTPASEVGERLKDEAVLRGPRWWFF